MDYIRLLIVYALELFLWFMIGRVVLQAMSGGRQTFFSELLQKITYPPYWAVRRITPASVGDGHIPLLSIPLIFALYILVKG